MSELPEPRAFDAASARVGEGDLASVVACGPDLAAPVAAARKFIDAGFTHLALVQIGADTQDKFMTWPLLNCSQHCASWGEHQVCKEAAGTRTDRGTVSVLGRVRRIRLKWRSLLAGPPAIASSAGSDGTQPLSGFLANVYAATAVVACDI
jgi:hypothetical protein